MSAYTDGLRALADLLDANPELPLPCIGETASSPANWYVGHLDDPAAVLASIARAVPGKVSKVADDRWFNLQFSLAGLHMYAYADRDKVCTRVVTGTREVTKTVKDPRALAAVPDIQVTETVEDVEWQCLPLLADRTVSAVTS